MSPDCLLMVTRARVWQNCDVLGVLWLWSLPVRSRGVQALFLGGSLRTWAALDAGWAALVAVRLRALTAWFWLVAIKGSRFIGY